ncbi:MAG: lysophospholipid acyltransferase family protein [Anaerosomatales bacterium]|nr:lysophospholipid acyltransferase family protein [Anaerosomatales bacterium]
MWLGRVLRFIGRPLVRTAFRVHDFRRENVPRWGGAVLAGNHRSYMDPVILWCIAPRHVHFMAKKELFHGLLGWALPRLWAFPVDRSGADRAALTKAAELLADGELVGIFPEGTRQDSDELGSARGGVAFVALRSNVPIVPIGIVGTGHVWPRGQRLPKLRRVTVVYGEPIAVHEFPKEGSRREQVDALTGLIMERIAACVDRAKEVHGESHRR